ncbi:uncharacterized protein PHACADRAFT_58383, partial [Phanerochaete carnosa HHB-10118-sp]
MDQLDMYILPHQQLTYYEKGARQVDAAGKEEKRAYTLCVASTAAGDILPFQQVWSGKTKASLPKTIAPSMAEAKELGFHFTFANSAKRTSHFSTKKTMKEWMIEVLELYISSVIKAQNLPRDQKAVLL